MIAYAKEDFFRCCGITTKSLRARKKECYISFRPCIPDLFVDAQRVSHLVTIRFGARWLGEGAAGEIVNMTAHAALVALEKDANATVPQMGAGAICAMLISKLPHSNLLRHKLPPTSNVERQRRLHSMQANFVVASRLFFAVLGLQRFAKLDLQRDKSR
jgi:hypothetical protein